MRIAFLGTPEFALPALSALYEAGHSLSVFTQPDRPVGRHAVLTPPPVKVYAQQKGIPVFQFERIRKPEGVSALSSFGPELMVTAAFGQLLSQENLDIPRYGCINVHGSLLPKYRGAAPIQWAVIDGCMETGVTTMQTNIGMDTGDVLLMKSTPIGPEETAGELSGRLSLLGAELLMETLSRLEAGTLCAVPQDEELATKCPMLRKEHGKLDFTLSAQAVHDRVRGTNPWPGAFALMEGETLKIWRTRIPAALPLSVPTMPGTLLQADGRLFVRCADGPLEIVELQAVGGKRMEADAFLRGRKLAGKALL